MVDWLVLQRGFSHKHPGNAAGKTKANTTMGSFRVPLGKNTRTIPDSKWSHTQWTKQPRSTNTMPYFQDHPIEMVSYKLAGEYTSTCIDPAGWPRIYPIISQSYPLLVTSLDFDLLNQWACPYVWLGMSITTSEVVPVELGRQPFVCTRGMVDS